MSLSRQYVTAATCMRFISKCLRPLLRRLFGETIMSVVYGIAIAEHDDPYVSLAEKATHIFGKITIPGQYPVESLPFLRHIPSWFPGAGFKRDALRWSEVVSAARNMPYDAAMDAFVCRLSV